jgi:hypothetical protein
MFLSHNFILCTSSYALVYWATVSHTNVIQVIEHRFERENTVTYMGSSITFLERQRDSSLNKMQRQSRPSMYDTNEYMNVCVPGSKLVQYKVNLAKFGVDKSCYGLSVRIRRWNTRIYLCWGEVVMRSLPLLGRLSADPVWFNVSQSREIVSLAHSQSA